MTRFLCRIYGVLLYAYPSGFRRRFGSEMAQAFADRCRGIDRTQGTAGLMRFGMHSAADWVATALREGIASMGEIAQSSGAPDRAFDGVPTFYTVGNSGTRVALIQGGLLTIAFFIALSFALAHSRSHFATLIGSHHSSRSHLLPARTQAVPKELASEIKANPYPDEVPINPYFRLILVLAALDADHDNIISAAEVANAPAALKTLDKNHDGKLSAEECGLQLPDKILADPQLLRRSRLAFMRIHPALAALDTDHDGEISAREIKNAPATLRILDANGDGRLTVDELLPDPVVSWTAQLMSALDKNGDGRISKEERSDKTGQGFRDLLDAADLNRDGVVTEEELTYAVRLRDHQR